MSDFRWRDTATAALDVAPGISFAAIESDLAPSEARAAVALGPGVIDAVSYQSGYGTALLADYAGSLGLEAVVWRVEDVGTARRAVAQGADEVVTDRPTLLRDGLDGRFSCAWRVTRTDPVELSGQRATMAEGSPLSKGVRRYLGDHAAGAEQAILALRVRSTSRDVLRVRVAPAGSPHGGAWERSVTVVADSTVSLGAVAPGGRGEVRVRAPGGSIRGQLVAVGARTRDCA